jgi:hypothetical protein
MALSYTQSSDLMKDAIFMGRVKVACLKYADYILNEAPSVAGHSSRYRWAQNTFAMPDGAASQVTPPVVMDPAVQQDGAAITDAALQSAVEGVVNKTI